MAIDFAGALQIGSSLLQVFGGLQAEDAAREQGAQQQAAADFAAWQADEQAGVARAIAQRQAEEARRQSRYVASRVLAVAAASGGGASDPTIVRLLANAEGEGAYRAQVAIYEGEARSRQLRLEAAAMRISGANAVTSANARATGIGYKTLSGALISGKSLYDRYGGGGPSLVEEIVPGQFSLDNPAYG